MTVTQEYQLILVQPQGRLDLQGGKALEKQLINLVANAQTLLSVDLAHIDFIDSSGLVALARCLKAARQSGCRLVLCNLQAPVKLIFELTQLDTVFEIFDNYDAVLTTIDELEAIA